MRIKRKILLMCMLAMMLTLLMGTALADTMRFGAVDGTGSVIVRAAASSDSGRVGSCERGTWMRILGEQGNYYKVRTSDGKTGYVQKDYLLVTSAAMGTIGVVDDAGYLNLRQGPSKTSKSLGQYDDGTPCILLSRSDGWYHVTVDGKAGYFEARYISTQYMPYSPEVATIITPNGGPLKMRTGPGLDYGVMRSFANRGYVMILQKGSGWWKVAAGGKIGYMDASCLRDGIVRKADAGAAGNASGGPLKGYTYAYVSNPNSREKLNLRSTASQNSASLGRYGNGTQVKLLATGATWCKVQVSGRTGYMMTKYLSATKPGTSSGSSGSLAGVSIAYVSNPGRNEKLILRQGASTDSKSAGGYGNGTKVTILSAGATWCRVRVDGKIGYMMTKYLSATKPGTSAGSTGPLSGASYAYVSNPGRNEKLNLRQSASQGSKSIGSYGNGTQVKLLTTGSTWCRVQVGSKVGYMMTKYLSLSKPDGSGSISGSKTAYVANPRANQKLHLRASASQGSKSLGAYGNGTKVTLLSTGAQWCKVQVGGKTGYMMTEFLALQSTSGVPNMWVRHPDGTYVNLRRSASQNSGVLVRVPHGAQVTVMTPGKYWTKIRYEGYTGYMMTQFLSD